MGFRKVNSLYKTILEHSNGISFSLLGALLITLLNVLIIALIYYFFIEYSTRPDKSHSLRS